VLMSMLDEGNRMRRRYVALLLLLIAACLLYTSRYYILNGWHERFGACAVGSYVAVQVEAIDAQTGHSLSFDVARRSTLIVRDGAYADTARLLAGAAPDRMGTYEVVVRAPGYQEWRTSGVRPARRVCYIKTAAVRAELQPIQ